MASSRGQGWLGRIQILAGMTALGLSPPAFATEYIVKLKGRQAAVAHFGAQKSFRGLMILDTHSQGGLIKVDISSSTKLAQAQRLAALMTDSEVEYVVENIKLHTLDMPNDPEISKQWALEKVKAFQAWDTGVGSRKIVIAVSDTGVDWKHPDLKDNIWSNADEVAGNGRDDDGNGYVDDVRGFDFKDNDADPMDVVGGANQNPGHGTHCAGIMGGVGDNALGISGMSQQVSIMPVRFIGPDGSGDLMGAVKTIDYGTDNGANIISASWGAAVSEDQAQPITEAIGRANDKGVIFVAAAANDGKNNDVVSMFPANTNLPNMITVAASDNQDAKPSWSNYGKAKVHVASPGLNIYSTLPAEKYGNLSGTSMATPLVAGLVGLILSHNDKLNGMQVRSILQATGAKVAIETACNCRVDAAEAVLAVRGEKLIVVPNAATLAPQETLQFSAIGGKAPFTYKSSNETIASISASGTLSANAEGETMVTVTDANGKTNQSLAIRVAMQSTETPAGDCPIEDPALCQLLCAIQPTLPWCSAK